MAFAQPRALRRGDRVGAFDCGVAGLNNWFRTLALKNQEAGASRTFVTIADDGSVAGYYSLSSFTIARDSTGNLGGGLPDPIPATLIGRLAVDRRFTGLSLGGSLLQDAALRAVQVSLQVGSAAIVVHTRDDSVVPFYERFGFTRLDGDKQTLILPMTDAVATVEALQERR
ncbi:acetyltransferase (GNAT) family protein [Homoserinimonas aerilata]|uniref:Acetyltransferase (GNAT) family protein n=1 Tax=Homoserinimonas aerilata TaxID=1162970 RepID=A0A542YGB9_9MICO|nr:GNAT family N-acetyltransferase [Homoserinimonas aerilata]TQL47123.1 acetyltransferase (GNAT) family protein [Homoserinimonas aerilata]